MSHFRDAACERIVTPINDRLAVISQPYCKCAERALAQADAALLDFAKCVDDDDRRFCRVRFTDLFPECAAAVRAARQRQEGRG